MKLFVYGTLKKAYGNNVLLSGAKFIGEAITYKPYVLFNCGFPKAVPFSRDEEKFPMLPVIGEVFEIDGYHLSRCDSLEGHPDWYVRKEVKVYLPHLEQEDTVMIYEMPEWPSHGSLCTIKDNNYVWHR